MARCSPGEGSISKRKDGRWQAALQIAGKRRTVYGATRAVAAKKLRVLTAEAASAGETSQGNDLTLAAYLSKWIEQAERRLRP